MTRGSEAAGVPRDAIRVRGPPPRCSALAPPLRWPEAERPSLGSERSYDCLERPRVTRRSTARSAWCTASYTGTCYASTAETDIEHIVAASEAHDSVLCARDAETRARFARDLRNLTLALPDGEPSTEVRQGRRRVGPRPQPMLVTDDRSDRQTLAARIGERAAADADRARSRAVPGTPCAITVADTATAGSVKVLAFSSLVSSIGSSLADLSSLLDPPASLPRSPFTVPAGACHAGAAIGAPSIASSARSPHFRARGTRPRTAPSRGASCTARSC